MFVVKMSKDHLMHLMRTLKEEMDALLHLMYSVQYVGSKKDGGNKTINQLLIAINQDSESILDVLKSIQKLDRWLFTREVVSKIENLKDDLVMGEGWTGFGGDKGILEAAEEKVKRVGEYMTEILRRVDSSSEKSDQSTVVAAPSSRDQREARAGITPEVKQPLEAVKNYVNEQNNRLSQNLMAVHQILAKSSLTGPLELCRFSSNTTQSRFHPNMRDMMIQSLEPENVNKILEFKLYEWQIKQVLGNRETRINIMSRIYVDAWQKHYSSITVRAYHLNLGILTGNHNDNTLYRLVQCNDGSSFHGLTMLCCTKSFEHTQEEAAHLKFTWIVPMQAQIRFPMRSQCAICKKMIKY